MTDEERPWGGFAEMGPLAAALAKAQAVYPDIPRTKEVDTGTYKFKYAPLDVVLSAVRKPLSDNGLAITQLIDGHELVTLLIHESGVSLRSQVDLPSSGTVQQLGSSITYLRRYALQAMLGVAAEEDDDGGASPTRDKRNAIADAAVARQGILSGPPAFSSVAATHRDGLIGIAEKTKDAAEFAEMRQGPDGHVLAFRLVEGRRAVKVVAKGVMAELVAANRKAIEGQRATVWGIVEDEPAWTPAGSTKPVVVQHVLLERLKVGDLDLSEPDRDDGPSEEEREEMADLAFPVTA